MTTITVYSAPGCQKCRMTIRYLDAARIEYRYVDVTTDPGAVDVLAMLGYSAGDSLPVVVAGDLHWSGYRDAKLERLAEIYAAAPDISGLEVAAVQYLADGAGE